MSLFLMSVIVLVGLSVTIGLTAIFDLLRAKARASCLACEAEAKPRRQ